MALLLFVSVGWGQDSPTPRLILNTFGPSSQLRSLHFSRDSRRLFAAGMDKVVHTWQVGWDADRAAGPPLLSYVAAMRWEIARGNRGSISAMAGCPTRDELIVGGVSARIYTGDIGLFDLQQDEVQVSLPTPAERLADQAASGHLEAVVGLDYSPSGNQIVSTSESGEVRLWRRTAVGGWQNSEVLAGGELQPWPARAAFASEDELVYGEPSSDGNYRLRRRFLKLGSDQVFPEPYARYVAAIERGPAGYWASADGDGNVYLTQTDGEVKRWQIRAEHPYILDLAFGPNNLLAVASNETRDAAAGQGVVELFEFPSRRRIDRIVISPVEKVRNLAISPDGTFLATDDDNTKEVIVYRLRDETGQLLTRPLSNGVPAREGGFGRVVQQVAVSDQPRAIAFGFQSDSLDYQIDAENGVVESIDPNRNWTSGIRQLGPWEARFEGSSRVVMLRSGAMMGRVELDPALHGTPTQLAWIPDPRDPDRPLGLAIGTSVINGIFVYSIPGQPGPPRLTRWYRDHTGTITALAASKDARLLVSGSADQMVKVWDLTGFERTDPNFPQASAWGASFALENGRLVVRQVEEAGIAFARGLRNGSVIQRVQGWELQPTEHILDAGANGERAADILDVLKRVSVLRQTVVDFTLAGNTERIVIRPAWEPLLSAYIDRRGEWAIWNPTGYYNASAAEGGELFGWQLNQGSDQPVRVLKGDFFQKEFEKPAIIRQLLATLSLPAALQAEGIVQQSVSEAVVQVPEVKIISPSAIELLDAQQGTAIRARVGFPGNDVDRFEVRASIDGFRLGPPDAQQQVNNDWIFTWNSQRQGLLSRIEVLATERGGALNSYYASDVVYRRGTEPTETPYRMSLLSLASEKYTGSLTSRRGGFGELQFPLDDVEAVVQLFREKQSQGLGRYALGDVMGLVDDQVNTEQLRQVIGDFNRSIRNSDKDEWLVVLISGHGTTVDGEFYYVTTDVQSDAPEEIKRKGIPWSLLSQAGEDNCRVIYMIDTCHSGSAVDAKSSLRDPKRSQGIVIAAASGREPAIEFAALGHGCFTYAVLRALEGYADAEGGNADQQVDIEELINFVKRGVATLTGGEQAPSTTPQQLIDALRVPLVAVPAKDS